MSKRNYKIAWNCLLVCLRNRIPLAVWIAPIPDEHKQKMLKAGREYIAKENARKQEPKLF